MSLETTTIINNITNNRSFIKKKSKRDRASLQQKMILEKLFQTNQYPDLVLRTQLSPKLGMSPRKIQIWFQNRRTKAKNQQFQILHNLSNLTEQFSDINYQNLQGNTLLIIASSSDPKVVTFLLNKGAKCNISNNKGWTPLFVAGKFYFSYLILYKNTLKKIFIFFILVKNGNEKIVDILLDKKYQCNPNIREFENGESPLHMAALVKYKLLLLFLNSFLERI